MDVPVQNNNMIVLNLGKPKYCITNFKRISLP